eukprot:sb/3463761/
MYTKYRYVHRISLPSVGNNLSSTAMGSSDASACSFKDRLRVYSDERVQRSVCGEVQGEIFDLLKDLFHHAGMKDSFPKSLSAGRSLWDTLKCPSKSKIKGMKKLELEEFAEKMCHLLLERCYPVLDRLSNEVEENERRVLDSQEELIAVQKSLVESQDRLVKLQCQLLEKRDKEITAVQFYSRSNRSDRLSVSGLAMLSWPCEHDMSRKRSKLRSTRSEESLTPSEKLINGAEDQVIFRGSRPSAVLVPRVYLDIMKTSPTMLSITGWCLCVFLGNHVKAARHLYDSDANGIDSYVRIHLTGTSPDQDWVTYIRINDPDPVFEEAFQLPTDILRPGSFLQLSAWRVEEGSEHSPVGYMAFPVEKLNEVNKRLLGWFELLDNNTGAFAYRPFVSLNCKVSTESNVGEMAEMQLSSNAETLDMNRRRAVVELVSFSRRYLVSLINKYKIYCKCLKCYLSPSHYSSLFGNLELVIRTQVKMFDYVKCCYTGRYAIGSVLRSWLPELACIIDYQRHIVSESLLLLSHTVLLSPPG